MVFNFEYTPEESRWPAYQKLFKKLFPTTPLYIFLTVAVVMLILMLAQHIYNESSRSLIYISLSLLFLLFGGCILYSTKKSQPKAERNLRDSFGKKQSYTISDSEVRVESAGEVRSFARSRLIGQYCTDKYYIFCISDQMSFIPFIVGITRENVNELNKLIENNNSRGIKMKKLRGI